mgnify:CR=1 FL=1
MEKKLYTGRVCKINTIDTDYWAEIREDAFNCIIIRINKLPLQVMENIRDNKGYNVLLLKLDNGMYLSVFNAYLQSASSRMSFDNGMPGENNSEIVLISSSAVIGNKFVALKDNFKKFRFEITDGCELIGLNPYDLNSSYSDIFKHKQIKIPMEIQSIVANTNFGKIEFTVTPKHRFKRDSFSIGFSHYILLELVDSIGIDQFREKLKMITDFFSLMCGEHVTINKLEVVEEEKSKLDFWTYKGYCNFPRWTLNVLDNSGTDTNNFKRISIFKLSDFEDLDRALNYWFEHYEALYNAQQAYSRILLDEDMKVATVNKYLAAMQLIEGYSQAYVDEKQAVKNFKKRRKEIIENLAKQEDKDYVKAGLAMPGITFKEACISFYWKGISIFGEISEETFKSQYEESLISKIVNDRNFYTHSSRRSKPELHFDELMDIAIITKGLYQCLVLKSMGMSTEIIKNRFNHNRIMEEKLYRIFNIQIKTERQLSEFDSGMWYFYDPKE